MGIYPKSSRDETKKKKNEQFVEASPNTHTVWRNRNRGKTLPWGKGKGGAGGENKGETGTQRPIKVWGGAVNGVRKPRVKNHLTGAEGKSRTRSEGTREEC